MSDFKIIFYNADSGTEFSLMLDSVNEYQSAKMILRDIGLIDNTGMNAPGAPTQPSIVMIDNVKLEKFHQLLKRGLPSSG